jgi:hypothetical protein
VRDGEEDGAWQVNKYYGKNPSQADVDAFDYEQMIVQRAPNAAGVPGAFVQIAAVPIDFSDLYTLYNDPAGAPTDWYRHLWWDGALLFSGESPALQAGDSQMRQWIRSDIPDADLTGTKWDDWIDQSLIDLYAFGLWKPMSQIITPTSANGAVNRSYNINGELRDVYAVEVIGTDASAVHQYQLVGNEFVQEGRSIRIPAASVGYKYVIWGKARFATVGELTDEGYMLLYHMVRAKYLQYRENQRANYRKFIVMDRDSDISPEQIRQMKVDAQAEVEKRKNALAFAEPAIPVPESGPSY